MSELLLIVVSAALANNLVIVHLLAADPALAGRRAEGPARDLSLLMLILMPVTTLTGYLILERLLLPAGLMTYRLPVLVLLLPAVSAIISNLLCRFYPALTRRIRLTLPLIIMNPALFGTVLLYQDRLTGLLQALAAGLGTAIGFGIITLMLPALTARLEDADIPKPFRGLAILYVSLGILAMALAGFIGTGP